MIIIFHEFGHFLFARLNGIRVVEFSLGFGPRILSHVSRKSGTRYSWKALPFGGSCQMDGEESEDTRPGTFGSKSVWRRMTVILAGPFFNFLLAFLFSLIIIGSVGFDEPYVLQVPEGLGAASAGIEPGDKIISIDGKRIRLQRELTNWVNFHQKKLSTGETVEIVYERDGERHAVQVEPKVSGSRYLLGINSNPNYRTRGNVLQVIGYSAYEVKYWIDTTLYSLGQMFQGKVKVEDVSGPVGVVKVIGDTYEESKADGWFYVMLNMLNLAILLSANLGVMNLLPFPALDGGRFWMLVVEAIRRKRVSANVEAAINMAGFVLLMGLMVLVMISDTRKIIG